MEDLRQEVMDTPIIELLKGAYPGLSSKQRRLAAYLINNNKDAAFLNASALSQASGVSQATVTRLAYSLGFKGYPELREALQAHAKSVLSLPKYVPANGDGFVLRDVAAMEKQIIDEMLESIQPRQFNQVARLLSGARSVSVVGTHYNVMPATYAAYFLQAVRPSVQLFTSVGLELFTWTQTLGRRDAALIVTTARYPKDTQRIVPLFKDQGAAIIAITDSQVSPVIPLADQVIIVPLRFFLSYVDPYAAVMVLIHALVTAVYHLNASKSKKQVQNYHNFMDYFDYHAIRDIKLN
jgi:DNA-binding MurR/RpiR family transcriptional regulator